MGPCQDFIHLGGHLYTDSDSWQMPGSARSDIATERRAEIVSRRLEYFAVDEGYVGIFSAGPKFLLHVNVSLVMTCVLACDLV